MRHNTGMPSEKVTTIIGRERLQNAFRKCHLKGTVKGTEKKILILELNVQRNRMTKDITTIRMMGNPHGHQTSVGVHNEVGALRVRLKHGPGRTAARERVTAMAKESVTTRTILETMTVIRFPTRIRTAALIGGRAPRATKTMTNGGRRRRRAIASITREARSRIIFVVITVIAQCKRLCI
jgi:hypothetical protein